MLERFHIWLGVEAAGIGLGIAVLWWLLTRRAATAGSVVPGGLVALAASTAGLMLVVWNYVLVTPVVVTAALVFVGGGLVRRPDRPIVGPMAVVSLVGVWAAVPDTEVPLVALGIVAVPVLLGRMAPTLLVDRLAAIGLVVGAAWIGSAGRLEVLGGIGCVGFLATLPSCPAVEDGSGADRPWWYVAAHAVVVVVSSRVLTGASRSVALGGLVGVALLGVVLGVVLNSRLPVREDPIDGDAVGAGPNGGAS